jgi:hypothetical protein
MCYDEYCRLHAACVAMAKQTRAPGEQARWLAMAHASLKVASELGESAHSASVVPGRECINRKGLFVASHAPMA